MHVHNLPYFYFLLKTDVKLRLGTQLEEILSIRKEMRPSSVIRLCSRHSSNHFYIHFVQPTFQLILNQQNLRNGTMHKCSNLAYFSSRDVNNTQGWR